MNQPSIEELTKRNNELKKLHDFEVNQLVSQINTLEAQCNNLKLKQSLFHFMLVIVGTFSFSSGVVLTMYWFSQKLETFINTITP